MLPNFANSDTHRSASGRLRDAGWELRARGDWSWVYRSPGGEFAARVTPFDPAYELHAEHCRRFPENPYLQRVERISPLAGSGRVVVMEFLFAADEEAARRLCEALGVASDTEPAPVPREPPAAGVAEMARDPALLELRSLLEATTREAASAVPFWGGLDVRPGNVMADARGQLKLIDPYFVSGRALIAAILEDIDAVAARVPIESLRNFLDIPALSRDADGDVPRRLRSAVEGALRLRGIAPAGE